jgi:signal recognition particle subunit SRP54
MLESFSEKLGGIFKKMSGQGRISEANIQEAMRELRFTLLDADVNFDVARQFIATVKERSLGEEVLTSLTPHQTFFKIVKDALVELLGGEGKGLQIAPAKPSVYVMCGIQGSGKTTTTGKLGRMLRRQGKKVLLTPVDVYRPAAIEQLRVVAEQNNLPFFFPENIKDPVEISRAAKEHARDNGFDCLFIDTAGRTHVDEAMMDEARHIRDAVEPTEMLLVLDGMTGQDAVNIANSFVPVGVTGLVLTKMDGDARGGAALSVRHVTDKPIKFIGTGEKPEDLEPFHPDRFVNRILGMGDLVSLIERVEETMDEEKARALEKKIRKEKFDFEDFLDQIKQVRKMGSVGKLLGMIPGMSAVAGKLNMDMADKQMGRIEAIVNSMTVKERRNPDIINASRKRRIARGSGTSIQEINALLKQFNWMKKMMSQMSRGKLPPGFDLKNLGNLAP